MNNNLLLKVGQLCIIHCKCDFDYDCACDYDCYYSCGSDIAI